MVAMQDRLWFLVSCLVFYWSLPLTVAFGEWSHSYSNRNDVFVWTLYLIRFFKVRLFRIGEQECYRSSSTPCIWLCNHRDWGDFFIDLYVVEGRSGFLSRLAVLIAFPVFGIYGLVTKTACFFRRNSKGRDFTKFNEMVTQHIHRSPCQGMVVYPEGTRNIKQESLPLRKGIIRYAYAEKVLVQIVITTNKEHVLSQKKKKACFGTKCIVGYSKLIDPSEYESFEEFFDEIQATWNEEWNRIYGASLSECVEVTPSNMKIFVPPYTITLGGYVRMILYSYFTVVLMISVWSFFFVLVQRRTGIHIFRFGDFATDVTVLSSFIGFGIVCSKMMTRKQD